MNKGQLPALAAAKAFAGKRVSISIVSPTLNDTGSIGIVNADFIKRHAEGIIKASPI